MKIELRPLADDDGHPTGTGCIIVAAGENSVRGIEYTQSSNERFLVICDGGLCVVYEFEKLGRGKWGVETVQITRELFRHQWQASIGDASVSDNGQYVCLQLLSNPEEPASNHLLCFDTTLGALLWQIEPETGGQRKRYRFDLEADLVYLSYHDGGPFPYRLSDGAFVGQEQFRQYRLARGEAQEAFNAAITAFEALQEAIELSSEERRLRAKAVFEKLGEATRRSPDWAPPYRTLGELFEWLPDEAKAIRCYEKALSLNPNIGCKRALARLQSRVLVSNLPAT